MAVKKINSNVRKTKRTKRGGTSSSRKRKRTTHTQSLREIRQSIQEGRVNKYSKAIADFCNFIEENYSDLPNIDSRVFLYEIDSLNSVYPKHNTIGKYMIIHVRYENNNNEIKDYIVKFAIPFDVYNKIQDQLQMIGYIYDTGEYEILNPRNAASAAG